MSSHDWLLTFDQSHPGFPLIDRSVVNMLLLGIQLIQVVELHHLNKLTIVFIFSRSRLLIIFLFIVIFH